jgi:hypothetical protein
MGGRTIYVYKYAILGSKDGINTEKGLNRWSQNKSESKKIEAIWVCEGNYSWIYKTDIPHATFDILEGGSGSCQGIVFSVDNI